MAANEPFFRVEFPSTLADMADVLDDAVDALKAAGWCGDRSALCARLCLEEAMVNAIIHGNQGDASRKVRLEMRDADDRCRLTVYDEGAGFSADGAEMPDCEKAGGRGVCLIKHYMEDVSYDRERGCLEMFLNPRKQCNGEPIYERQ